jgi:hypothetical protein
MSGRSLRSCAAVVALGAALLSCGGDGGPAPEPLPDCENRGDQYFAGIAKTTDDGATTIQITSAAPAPPANSSTNRWELLVTDATGANPITSALVIAAPYMVDHGHGAPNVIATESDGGAYVVDPLYLKMNGLWDVTIKVTPQGGTESRVLFSFCVLPL